MEEVNIAMLNIAKARDSLIHAFDDGAKTLDLLNEAIKLLDKTLELLSKCST